MAKKSVVLTEVEDAEANDLSFQNVKFATCHLKSISPYSQSKHYEVPKRKGENSVDYEIRTWQERLHVNAEGFVYIPPMAFSNSLKEAAKYLGIAVPGKGKNLYTKHFEAGVMVIDDLVLPLRPADVQPEKLFLPSDGRRGGGKRVVKYMPKIPTWEGVVTYHINDPVITEAVFTETLHCSARLIGIGRFRPRNLGYYGCFDVLDIRWSTA